MYGFLYIAGGLYCLVTTAVAGFGLYGYFRGAESGQALLSLIGEIAPKISEQVYVAGGVGVVWLFVSIPGFLLITIGATNEWQENTAKQLRKLSELLEQDVKNGSATADTLRQIQYSLDRRQ